MPSRAALRRRATRAPTRTAASGPAEIRAIIPGRVVAVRVAAGDAVEAGRRLLVVEAMKMQNELRAPRAGTVGRVAVGPGRRSSRRPPRGRPVSDRIASATSRGQPPRSGRRARALAGDDPRAKALEGGPGAAGPVRDELRTSRSRDLYTARTSRPPASTRTATSGCPASRPFTRGVQATMYRSRFWTMRQYAGFATAEETNQRFRYLLEQGQTGLSVAFDLPTQMGYDSDAPEAEGEVGRVGVPISSLADMETLVDGHPARRGLDLDDDQRDGADPRWRCTSPRPRGRASPRDRVSGTVQNDILKEYIARGTWIYPPATSMRLVTDIFEFCAARAAALEHDLDLGLPHARGRGDRRPGAGVHPGRRDRLLRGGASRAGLAIDDFAPRLSFFFAAWSELFEEVAKFRAARRMWARIVRDRFGSSNARSMACRFHVQTAGSSLTAQSIDNNVVRTTVQALAAVLGGAQSLHTNSRDEALALPTEARARLALRTQQILAYESGVTETPDPLAGSYFVETPDRPSSRRPRRPTSTRSTRWAGRCAALEGGFQQRQIQESAYRVQRAIDAGDQVVVGRQPVPRRGQGRSRRRRSSGSTRRASAARSSGVRRVRAERDRGRLGGGHRAGSRTPRAARTTCCRRSSRPSRPTPRSARSATGSGPRGASTAS